MPPFLVCKGNFFIEDKMAQVCPCNTILAESAGIAMDKTWLFQRRAFLVDCLIRGQKPCSCKDYARFK